MYLLLEKLVLFELCIFIKVTLKFNVVFIEKCFRNSVTVPNPNVSPPTSSGVKLKESALAERCQRLKLCSVGWCSISVTTLGGSLCMCRGTNHRPA